MNEQELINSNEIQWLIAHSQKMTDYDGNEIKGSSIFSGKMPARMIETLRNKLDQGAQYNDCGREVVYSFNTGNTEKDSGYTFTFGAYKSTAKNIKFTACPYTW